MTLIIGIEHEGKIFMGGDSCGSDDWGSHPIDEPKVFRSGNMLIGYTTSYRMGQILHYQFNPPNEENLSPLDYIHKSVMPAIRTVLKDNGFAKIENSTEQFGTFLIGYCGMLFKVQEDFAALRYSQGFNACGIGYITAQAVLECVWGHPKDRILQAMHIAKKFHPGGIMEPYTILEL